MSWSSEGWNGSGGGRSCRTAADRVTFVVTRIQVGGERPYDVHVGRELGGELARLVDGAARVAVIFAAPLRERAARLTADLAGVTLVEVPDGEPGKTVEVIAQCWEEMGKAGF